MQQPAQKWAFCVHFSSACQRVLQLLLDLHQLQFQILIRAHGFGNKPVGHLHSAVITGKARRGDGVLHDEGQYLHAHGSDAHRVVPQDGRHLGGFGHAAQSRNAAQLGVDHSLHLPGTGDGLEQLPGKLRVGRVLGRENDLIALDDSGTLIVNGTAQSGEILYPTYAKDTLEYPYTVPADSVFILGDYRTQSEDSRDFGPVALTDVKAKVITLLRRRSL